MHGVGPSVVLGLVVASSARLAGSRVWLAGLAVCFALGCEERKAPAAAPPAAIELPTVASAQLVFPEQPVQHADVIRQSLVPGLGQVLVCRGGAGEAVCDLRGGTPHRLWPQSPAGVSHVDLLGVWQRGPVLLAERSGNTTIVALVPGGDAQEHSLTRARYQVSAGYGSDSLPADGVSRGRALFFRTAESAPTATPPDLELVLFDLTRATLEPVSGGRAAAPFGFAARWLSSEAFLAASQRDKVVSPGHSRTVFAVHEQTLATFLFAEHNGGW